MHIYFLRSFETLIEFNQNYRYWLIKRFDYWSKKTKVKKKCSKFIHKIRNFQDYFGPPLFVLNKIEN